MVIIFVHLLHLHDHLINMVRVIIRLVFIIILLMNNVHRAHHLQQQVGSCPDGVGHPIRQPICDDDANAEDLLTYSCNYMIREIRNS